MDKNLPFISKSYLLSLVIFLAFLFSNPVQGQCAGDDPVSPITVCDIANVSSQSINLFSYLGGSPVAGGTWSDDLLSGGLNPATGILNVQQIRVSGMYSYTYTVTGISGCSDNTSTVYVIVGPFAGVAGPNGVECSDKSSYNLFQLFNGTGGNASPQSNGTWFNVTTGTSISGSNFNPSAQNVTVPTTFEFRYTVSGIGSCPDDQETAFLTIYPKPEAGTAIPLELCSADSTSFPTALNLFDMLSGEDSGGRWIDNSSTNELTFASDSVVNVQNIYNNFGPGVYTFTYEVNPSNPICTKDTVSVTITIERFIDYSNINLSAGPDACLNNVNGISFTTTLNQTPSVLPQGTYNLTYTVSGQVTPVNTTVTVDASGNISSFSLPSSNFPTAGTYTVTVTSFEITSALGFCPNNFTATNDTILISPLPSLSGATLTAQDVCQNSASSVSFSGASLLPDGSYTITYNVTGNNAEPNQMASITVTGGNSSIFSIAGNLLPNAGATNIVITSITNNATGCTSNVNLLDAFQVLPLPVTTNLNIVTPDVCAGQSVVVTISGFGTLTNAQIAYTLSGANTATSTATFANIVGGSVTYTIPTAEIPNTGATTFAITNLINTTTTCSIVVTNKSDDFAINPLPSAPVASNQIFCEAANATVANLVPSGTQYKWYTSLTSTTPIANTTALANGTYYVSLTNATTGCESQRTSITVTIDVVSAPVLNADGQNFCGRDNPTIADLSNNTNASATVQWYDAQTGGNLLVSTTPLVEGTTYYGFDSNTVTGCLSKDVLAVTVTLTDCDVTADFFIPDGFSPNGDGINDTFRIPDIEFIYPNYTIEIYNRYGNLLFEGNKNKDWDGKNSTSNSLLDGVVPNGVYFYVINFNKANTPAKQGRLYLNR